ncbi:MAG: TldD/PmbA family protein [Anaerolineales bacterium]
MANLNLPSTMADVRPSLPDLVTGARNQAPYFAILLSATKGTAIRVDNREEQITEQTPSEGTVLTAFDGKTVTERAVGGFDRRDIEREKNNLIQASSFNSYSHPNGDERRADFVTTLDIDPLSLSTQEKLDRCRTLHARVKGLDERIVNAIVSYAEVNEFSVFVNHASDLAQRVQRIRLTVVVFVSGSDGQVRYDWTSKSGTAGWEILEFSDDELKKLVASAGALLSAERIEPGEYQVITAPGVSGTICHESFGHGVETDMFLKQRAKAAFFIDKTVGAPLVNIYDDPSRSGGFGSYFFDDEGCLSSLTTIVENGVFKRGISDLYSATALNIPRSANGRRQDFSRKAYARMSNTFFGPGSSTLEDLLAQVDHGIYLDRWSSGMEDPQGWGIQVTCHYGHEIKGGKITDRVFAPIGVSGYVPDVLQSVSAVSNELVLDPGTCGKGHKEQMPVSSGGPHMLLRAQLG